MDENHDASVSHNEFMWNARKLFTAVDDFINEKIATIIKEVR